MTFSSKENVVAKLGFLLAMIYMNVLKPYGMLDPLRSLRKIAQVSEEAEASQLLRHL